jgi:hypothetical protein
MGAESQLRQGPDQASGLAEAVYFDSGGSPIVRMDAPSVRGCRRHPRCRPLQALSATRRSARIAAFAALRSPSPPPVCRRCGSTTWAPGILPEIDPKADQIQAWARDVTRRQPRSCAGEPAWRACVLPRGTSRGPCWPCSPSAECAASGLVLISPILSGRRYLRAAANDAHGSVRRWRGSGAAADSSTEAGVPGGQRLHVVRGDAHFPRKA